MNERALATTPGPDPIGPEIRELGGLIKAMLPNGNKLTDQEALAGAMYGKAHNLSPFKGEYYIVPGKGIYPGYRGEMALRDDKEFYTQYRPMNSDEATEHEIQPGDTARICELYQPGLMAHMRALGIPYRPILGIGIVSKADKWITEEWVGESGNRRKVKIDPPRRAEPPKRRSWAWVAEQSAFKDALRHMAGGADILEETVQDQLDEADQRANTITAEFKALPPEEQQAKFAANVEAVRGPVWQGLGDDDPPDSGNGHEAEAAAEFAAMPSASKNLDKPHWIANDKARTRFWAWATQHDLSKDDVHKALKVAHIEQFAGDMGQAKTLLTEYYNARTDAQLSEAKEATP